MFARSDSRRRGISKFHKLAEASAFRPSLNPNLHLVFALVQDSHWGRSSVEDAETVDAKSEEAKLTIYKAFMSAIQSEHM
jgi:hypothetical protein